MLGLGTPPTGVSVGTVASATVTINDDPNDVPAVTVQYAAASYSVDEGSSVTVTVELSEAPQRSVTVPITATLAGGADGADYSGVPASVTFGAAATTATFDLAAVHDSFDDDGESVVLGLGAPPTGVTVGSTATATVTIIDDPNDVPDVTVQYAVASYSVDEGSAVTVTVELSEAPQRSVTVPVTATLAGGAGGSDYSGVPASVTFGATATTATFDLAAVHDSFDDDGESVVLGLGTPPTGVTVGTVSSATVTIIDDPNDVPDVTVQYAVASYSVNEGSSVTVTVELSEAPQRSVTVPITATLAGGADGSDYSGVPATVTFAATATTATFNLAAADDSFDDDGESIVLGLGAPPTGVSVGTVASATVTINDDPNDVPGNIIVQYAVASYSVDEGSAVTVTVELSEAPQRSVTVPITATLAGGADGADYSGVPASVTFGATATTATFDLAAVHDSFDDDGESIVLGLGTPPTGVTVGTVSSATVTIIDDPNDVPDVTVQYAAASYRVDEGSAVTVTVELSEAPQRSVTVPVTATLAGGAEGADYSGVPASVTFGAAATTATFDLAAVHDSFDDDGESVVLGLGAPPTGVSVGSTATATVTIVDDPNDVPDVTVQYAAASYSVDEGSAVTVTVELSEAPQRSVTVPVTATLAGGAGGSDYSGVPATVSFAATATTATFDVAAVHDSFDDDGESIVLGLGAPPDRCQRRHHRDGDGDDQRRSQRRARRHRADTRPIPTASTRAPR